MLVEFEYPWFAPSEKVVKDKIIHISGRHFKKGVQEVPKELTGFLPKSAKIVEEVTHEPAPAPTPPSLIDLDVERAGLDLQEETVNKAEAVMTEVKVGRGRPRKNK